jgi:hypothetical protein
VPEASKIGLGLVKILKLEVRLAWTLSFFTDVSFRIVYVP